MNERTPPPPPDPPPKRVLAFDNPVSPRLFIGVVCAILLFVIACGGL